MFLQKKLVVFKEKFPKLKELYELLGKTTLIPEREREFLRQYLLSLPNDNNEKILQHYEETFLSKVSKMISEFTGEIDEKSKEIQEVAKFKTKIENCLEKDYPDLDEDIAGRMIQEISHSIAIKEEKIKTLKEEAKDYAKRKKEYLNVPNIVKSISEVIDNEIDTLKSQFVSRVHKSKESFVEISYFLKEINRDKIYQKIISIPKVEMVLQLKDSNGKTILEQINLFLDSINSLDNDSGLPNFLTPEFSGRLKISHESFEDKLEELEQKIKANREEQDFLLEEIEEDRENLQKLNRYLYLLEELRTFRRKYQQLETDFKNLLIVDRINRVLVKPIYDIFDEMLKLIEKKKEKVSKKKINSFPTHSADKVEEKITENNIPRSFDDICAGVVYDFVKGIKFSFTQNCLDEIKKASRKDKHLKLEFWEALTRGLVRDYGSDGIKELANGRYQDIIPDKNIVEVKVRTRKERIFGQIVSPKNYRFLYFIAKRGTK